MTLINHKSSVECACPHRQFHTQPRLLDSQTALSNSHPYTCVQRREAVCTIFMMVFGMTRLGRDPTAYRVRGGHANHYANPTQSNNLNEVPTELTI